MEEFFLSSQILLILSPNVSGQSIPCTSNTNDITPPCTYDYQCVDHNDSNCSDKWSQRYWANSAYYQEGGPLFVFLGGEVDTSGWADSGAWLFYAAEMRAYTLVIEHRFYGESWPTPQTNRSAAAMQMLTIQQALMDYAKIIQWFKAGTSGLQVSYLFVLSMEDQTMEDNAKVVVFGGSYAGGLAAWFRVQFPHLANVAVTSSAVLNYTYEFPEFFQTSSQVIKHTNPDCFNAIKEAFTCMHSIFNNRTCAATKITERDDLSKLMGLPIAPDFYNEIFLQVFFYVIGPAIWINNNPGTTSENLCEALLNETVTNSDIVSAYGTFIRKSGRDFSLFQRKQVESNQTTASNYSTNDPGGYKYSWIWQICNEFANLHVADPVHNIFSTDDFGSSFRQNLYSMFYPDAGFTAEAILKNVQKTQKQYKAGKEYNGTCVIFINGSWDPWASKSITSANETSPQNSVFYIEKGEHMDDMFYPPINPFANSSISDIHVKIGNQIGVYLESPACQTSNIPEHTY